VSPDRTNDMKVDMSSRWVEWKVEASWADRGHEHTIVALIDGPSGALLGRANIVATTRGRAKRIHLVIHVLNGRLGQKYTIELEEGEDLSPIHFEPLVADVEKVLPGLSGDVITAIFQAINAVKTLKVKRRLGK